jgi:hypothetical protein
MSPSGHAQPYQHSPFHLLRPSAHPLFTATMAGASMAAAAAQRSPKHSTQKPKQQHAAANAPAPQPTPYKRPMALYGCGPLQGQQQQQQQRLPPCPLVRGWWSGGGQRRVVTTSGTGGSCHTALTCWWKTCLIHVSAPPRGGGWEKCT